MNLLEKDLEEVIFNTSREKLYDRGLPVFGKMVRQLKLGKYGILDLLTVTRNVAPWEKFLTFTIYELKKDTIGVSAFFQSVAYAKAIQEFMKTYRPNIFFNIEICLIGKSIDTTGSFCFLPDLFSYTEPFHIQGQVTNVSFYTYHFSIDGFSFKEHSGYCVPNAFKK